MRSTKTPLVALAVLLGACLGAPAVHAQDPPKSKKLYCWNNSGTRVCSDQLPPDQSQGARTEINASTGRTTGQVERTQTDDERRAAASVANQAQQAAEVEAARARRDLAMVESYASEADLRRAFNDRIVLVEESIKTSTLSESNLRLGLVSLLTQASDLELAGKPVGKGLLDNIQSQHAELNKQLAILQQQRSERTSLNGDLDAALQRYRDLKAKPGGETVASEGTTQ